MLGGCDLRIGIFLEFDFLFVLIWRLRGWGLVEEAGRIGLEKECCKCCTEGNRL